MKKTCKKCGTEKEYSEFYTRARMKDGHSNTCKSCDVKSSYEWNKQHRERKNANNRKWHEGHREYNAKNAREWRENNYSRYRENIDRWNNEHRDKYLNYPIQRRARILNAPINDLTQDEWEQIKAAYGYRCAYCGKKTELTRDHVIPLIKGGSHTASNIVPACIKCNSSKSDRDAPIYQPLLIRDNVAEYDLGE